MSRRLACLTGLGASAAVGCATPPDLRPPPLPDPYSRYVAAAGPQQRRLRECLTNVRLGATAPAVINRLRLTLLFPVAFVAGPRNLLVDSLLHPAFGYRWAANQWLPGLYVEDVWYRWTRVEPGGTDAIGLPSTLIQLVRRRGYPVLHAVPPWTMSVAGECGLRMPNRTARVLRSPFAPQRRIQRRHVYYDRTPERARSVGDRCVLAGPTRRWLPGAPRPRSRPGGSERAPGHFARAPAVAGPMLELGTVERG